MGLTRPGAPMAGLPDDFVITLRDVPKAAEPSEEGQDLPPEILRQLCSHLDLFESMCCPELRSCLDDLLRTREKLLAMPEADAWARAEAAPSDEEIRRARRLIQRVTEDVDQLTDDERDQIQQAAAIVRKTRQGFLGMPRIRRPLPDLRPERPA
ncbi:hypothetical protein [Streptomyces griseocarneus]|uniref:hypothetical protein n=1 Tax=Streptomyces griseocarneus TaxID=51201 RepID=UPI0019929DD6|nr:hypothetical protein [Streptomyces griseocarneus]MBZ6476154.1 hypothetical protein [Streptomyces griseocarneus]GHG63678.1 hypothetical protein GCM10018779_33520 [Streptomyces griseocarneus]